MSVGENIRIVQEYSSSHAPEYAAEEVIYHDYSQPEAVKGRQAVDQLLDSFYRTGFSDVKLEIRHIAADENCVTLEVTFHGINTGTLRGHPPTGKRVELPVCRVYDIADASFVASGSIMIPDCSNANSDGWQAHERRQIDP